MQQQRRMATATATATATAAPPATSAAQQQHFHIDKCAEEGKRGKWKVGGLRGTGKWVGGMVAGKTQAAGKNKADAAGVIYTKNWNSCKAKHLQLLPRGF